MKKTLNILLVFAMLLSLTATAFATTSPLVVNAEIREEILSSNNQSIQPLSWGGAAAQVTKIELYDIYLDAEDHLFVWLKVTGYGHDTTYLNDQKITKKTMVSSFTLDGGPGADGFIYSYDCGQITEPGNYVFSSVFTSTNHPYSKKSIEFKIPIEYAS